MAIGSKRMAKLSPFQRQVLAQIANPEPSVEGPPLFPLGTIKALMVRGLIKRAQFGLAPEAGSPTVVLNAERLVPTPAGLAALSAGCASASEWVADV